MFDIDLGTAAQLVTAAVAALFAFFKALSALVKLFKKEK
nr:MAG: hypothetical protein [Microvirus sp.]